MKGRRWPLLTGLSRGQPRFRAHHPTKSPAHAFHAAHRLRYGTFVIRRPDRYREQHFHTVCKTSAKLRDRFRLKSAITSFNKPTPKGTSLSVDCHVIQREVTISSRAFL